MHLRYLIMEMCLDIEHAIKVKLVNEVTKNPNEDGYELVRKYLRDEDQHFYLLKSIKLHKSGEYCRDLINKYYPYFPIWVLTEIVSFGSLLHICQFYEDQYNVNVLPKNKFMNIVRDFRNASAHSNCLLNQLNQGMDSSKQPDYQITTFVKNLHVASKKARHNNLHKNFAYEIIVLLFVYNELMPDISKQKRFTQLSQFVHSRVQKHSDYFKDNSEICGVYTFLQKVIDKLSI